MVTVFAVYRREAPPSDHPVVLGAGTKRTGEGRRRGCAGASEQVVEQVHLGRGRAGPLRGHHDGPDRPPDDQSVGGDGDRERQRGPRRAIELEGQVRAENPDGRLRRYPGSPLIARGLLRAGDRAILSELNKKDCAQLEALFAHDRRVVVRLMDGYQSLKAHLPPKERRGLVLIDSSFDRKHEFERLSEALRTAHERWATGVYAVPAVRDLLQTGLPLFGICLGHQILSLALGARTVKMNHGHHGANHPVKDLATGKVEITSQNHGFAVDAPRGELAAKLRPRDQLLRGGPAEPAPRAVADGAERALHRPRLAREDEARRAHAAGDEDRLADGAIDRRQVGMSGAEGPGRALAVNEKPPLGPRDLVPFLLAGVVRDVEQDGENRLGENTLELAPFQIGENLTIGQGAVDAGTHRPEVGLAKFRTDRRAGEYVRG